MSNNNQYGIYPYEVADTQTKPESDYTAKDKAAAWLNQYENRDPYAYDINADAMYQQYRDMYAMNGEMAAKDAMGQAAAMTGGYGNSYAQSVGLQTYNQYLDQLNGIMLELDDRAYSRYHQEGQQMLDMYDRYMNSYLAENTPTAIMSTEDFDYWKGFIESELDSNKTLDTIAASLYGAGFSSEQIGNLLTRYYADAEGPQEVSDTYADNTQETPAVDSDDQSGAAIAASVPVGGPSAVPADNDRPWYHNIVIPGSPAAKWFGNIFG